VLTELTDEDRARLLAEWIADRVPRVARLTGLPVVAVERVALRPEQTDSPKGYLVRIEDGRAAVVPCDPQQWKQVVAVLRRLGKVRPINRDAGERLMRALEDAARC
jgi:hypothetical protein